MTEPDWERWRPFPDPREGDMLVAPFGPGVYWLRDSRDGECVYIGQGANVASRMSSLLPRPHGCGHRDNAALRRYILKNLGHIDYRTTACTTKREAKVLEKRLRAENECRF